MGSVSVLPWLWMPKTSVGDTLATTSTFFPTASSTSITYLHSETIVRISHPISTYGYKTWGITQITHGNFQTSQMDHKKGSQMDHKWITNVSQMDHKKGSQMYHKWITKNDHEKGLQKNDHKKTVKHAEMMGILTTGMPVGFSENSENSPFGRSNNIFRRLAG